MILGCAADLETLQADRALVAGSVEGFKKTRDINKGPLVERADQFAPCALVIRPLIET